MATNPTNDLNCPFCFAEEHNTTVYEMGLGEQVTYLWKMSEKHQREHVRA